MSIDVSRVTAIDPPGCGCTECMVGEYIPLDSYYLNDVLEAALTGQIEISNHLHDSALIIYRDTSGAASYTTDSAFVERSDYIIIPPNGEDVDEPDVVDVSELDSHSSNWEDDSVYVLVEAIVFTDVFHSVKAGNPTDTTYVVYKTPDRETGTVPLYNCSDSLEPLILFSR